MNRIMEIFWKLLTCLGVYSLALLLNFHVTNLFGMTTSSYIFLIGLVAGLVSLIRIAVLHERNSRRAKKKEKMQESINDSRPKT